MTHSEKKSFRFYDTYLLEVEKGKKRVSTPLPAFVFQMTSISNIQVPALIKPTISD